MVCSASNLWDFYFLTCADASYYEFFMNWAILHVDPAGQHDGNQSTHAEVISCQVSCFAYNLNNQSSYQPY